MVTTDMATDWIIAATAAQERYPCTIAFSRFVRRLLEQACEQSATSGFTGRIYFFADNTSILDPGNGGPLLRLTNGWQRRGGSNASGRG